MKKILIVLSGLMLFATGICFAGGDQEKTTTEKVNIEFWNHWDSTNTDFGPFLVKAAKEFNTLYPEVDFSINMTAIPYAGYEAKYSNAFEAGMGPGIFTGMTHVWQGEFNTLDPMPKDIADKLENILVEPAKPYGVFEGQRYGLPIEGGNFMMMFINVDMFMEAGLDPNKPPKTYTELLDYAKKLTKYDENGEIIQAGYAVRYKGHPFGVADKSAPFFNAWGAEWLNWEEKKASGYLNSSKAVEALQFYGDLVIKHKVSTLEIDNPVGMFSQGLAAIIFRESWLPPWLAKNAPNINYKVYPLPSEKMESGYTNNFPWAINVNKELPENEKLWLWEFFRWYINNTSIRKEHYIKSGVLPPYSDILDDSIFTNRKDYEAWKEMVAGRASPTYYIPPSYEILQIIGDSILSVLYGKETAQDSLDIAAKKIDEILVKY